MAKTTKKARGIHSWVKFQKHQGVQSLTIEGKQELADLSQDKNGGTSLILNADKDKVNTIVSSVPYIGISHTTTGADPNQEKTATVSQDLTQFPLNDGELVKFNKQKDGISVNDEELKADISQLIKAEIDKIPVAIGYFAKLFDKYEKVTTNITFKDDEEFSGYLLIHVRAKNNSTTFFHFNRENFIDADKPYKIFNDYMLSVRADLTPEKNLVLTFNQHEHIEEFELYYQWFTSMQKAPIEPRLGDKRITMRVETPTEHFEGYEDPTQKLTYEPIPPVPSTPAETLTYEPNPPLPSTPAETPSNPPSLPNVIFPIASTSPQPEVAGNQPEPIAEESH